MNTILMCPPDYYAIKYEINPWMHIEKKINPLLARQQWLHLYQTITQLGASVKCMKPIPLLPDIVFTANAGFFYQNCIILSHFKYPERQREQLYFKHWFEDQGCRIMHLPEEIYFEGTGDCLLLNNLLFLGYGFRSDWQVQLYFSDYFPFLTQIPCQLIDPYFYHLDTCFCPLTENLALIYRGAFAPSSLALMDYYIETIHVPHIEAQHFACNAVMIDQNIVMPAGCPITRELLLQKGFKVYEVEMTEFIKAGGACKCLTLQM